MQTQVIIGIQANLDALNKSIKAINKSMKIDLGINIKNALEEATKGLKAGLAKNAPTEEIKALKKKIREASKVELSFKLDQATNQLKNLVPQILGTYATLKAFISKPVSANLEFNTAINEINKFASFSQNELEVFKKDMFSLGKTNGIGMNDILKMSELSAQLGVGKNELKDFTQNAINLKIGLGLSQEEAVNLSSSISKAFNMGVKEIKIFSDEVTSMAKATSQSGKKILEVTSSTLAGAKAFGLSAKETSALSSAFLSVGLDSSEASSSINKFFTELNNIDNASEGFKRSLNKMGLDAEGLKEDIQNNPQEAIKDLFNSMNDLDDEERFGVISEIFGKKMANNINSAKDGMKAFDKALLSTKDSAGALGKAVDRAAGDGFGDVVLQLGNAFKHLGVSIGNGFVPILKPLFEGIKNITNAFSGFLDNHQWVGKIVAFGGGMLFLTKTVGLLAMAFQPLKTLFFYPFQVLQNSLMISDTRFKISAIIAKAYAMSIGGIKNSFIRLKGSLSNALFSLITFDFNLFRHNALMRLSTLRAFSLKNAMFALVPSFKQAGGGIFLLARIIRGALMGIKIALISTGVGVALVGLGVIGYGIMRFWKPIGAFFGGLFSGIAEGLSPLKESFMGLWNALKTAFAPITNLLGVLFGKLFSQMDSTQEEMSSFAKVGFVIGKAIGAVLSVLAKPFEWLMQIITLALEGVASATNWLENSALGKWILGDDDKNINTNATTHLKGSIDEVITKQNENKTKMLSSISSNDNSRQINDYKNITINTNANPEAIASAINSYSYDDDL